jgi:hypothetical protein
VPLSFAPAAIELMADLPEPLAFKDMDG